MANINKKKDAPDFNSIINKLSSTSKKIPWYKKRSSVIAMSSTLGFGVLAVAIVVPVIFLVDFSSKKSEPISLKVERFNSKSPTEKIASFNKMITPQFQSSVYDFWMKDSTAIVAGTSPIKESQFYKYMFANLDQTTISFSEIYVRRALIEFMTYYTTPPLSGSGNSFTPVTNNMFKIFTLGDTALNFISSVKISATNVVNIYTFSSLFYANNILDLQFNLNLDETLDVSITNNDLASNFLNFVTTSGSPPGNNGRTYKYNTKYTLNDEYTNKLLSPLITNFLIANY